MGAYLSQIKLKTTEPHQVSSYDLTKLRKLLTTADKSTVVDDCLRVFARCYSTPLEQWNLLEEAVCVLERQGKYRRIMEFAARQIELLKAVPVADTDCADVRRMKSRSFLSLAQ